MPSILKRNLVVILAAFLSAVSCGAVFLFSLYRQFALVEVAASIATGAEVYFLSSSIGDLLEDKKEPNYLRVAAGVGLAAVVAIYFLVIRFRTA